MFQCFRGEVAKFNAFTGRTSSLARQAFGVNQQIAGQGVNLLAQLLLDGEIGYHGSMMDLKTGFASPIAVDPQIWASFGYERAA